MSPVESYLQMLGVKPARHKPTQVRRAQITDVNIDDLADWIRYETGDYHSAHVYTHADGSKRLHLKCDKGQQRIADIGDYLIRASSQEFYAITQEVYLNRYEDVPQEA